MFLVVMKQDSAVCADAEGGSRGAEGAAERRGDRGTICRQQKKHGDGLIQKMFAIGQMSLL